MSDYEDEEEMEEESGHNLGVIKSMRKFSIQNLKYYRLLIFQKYFNRNTKVKETKRMKGMDLVKLNYQTAIPMKAIIKTAKDTAKELTSIYIYINPFVNFT
jgi:hypothetical protein